MSRALPPVPALDRRARRALATILAGGALVRLAWALAAAREPTAVADPALYLHLGEMVADGEGYAYFVRFEVQPTAYYPPGYPLLLGALFWLVGLMPFGVSLFGTAVALNLVLSVATVALVFELGRRLVDLRVGLVAAAITALWPNLVFYSGAVLTETLFLFLFVLMLLVALPSPAVARSPGLYRLAAVGLLFGAAGMVRPTSFVLGPLFLLLWWRSGVLIAVRRTAIVAVVVFAVVLPWTARNVVRSGEPVLISTNMGDNLCIGHHPDAGGGYNEACLRDERGVPIPDLNDLGPGESRLDYEIRRQSELLDLAERSIRDDPLRVLTSMPAKLRYTLDRDTDGLDAVADYPGGSVVDAEFWNDTAIGHRTIGFLARAADAYYVAIMVAGLAGAVLLLRRDDRARRGTYLLAVAAIQLVPPLLTFGDARFKVPIYPAVTVAAAAAIVVGGELVGRTADRTGRGGPPDDDHDEPTTSTDRPADEPDPDSSGPDSPGPRPVRA